MAAVANRQLEATGQVTHSDSPDAVSSTGIEGVESMRPAKSIVTGTCGTALVPLVCSLTIQLSLDEFNALLQNPTKKRYIDDENGT